MSGGVHNNIALMNAGNQYKVTTGKKSKSSEKLASGYRINRSADDAAGLAISEKMRAQIRGLNRGTQNAQDGISWVQTGDGALNEVHALLQRMRELTIQSLNDTNTEEDRAACQAEFDALQSEIDRITGDTQFNTQNIFDEHELPYYQCEGNVKWEQAEKHIVASDKNKLIIEYRSSETDAVKKVEIEVPAGVYTTQELIDEIEDAAIAGGQADEGFRVEFTQFGTCNLNLEGGEVIDSIGGGLAYLFYDMYEGGGFGALIGTTKYVSENVRLEIKEPNNNYMKFQIEDFNGNSQEIEIDIEDGEYTRQELIDKLNAKLQGTDVTAVAYGTGIKLQGENSIVTGFKGNMFKIDEDGKIYDSVFYDNISYGSITMYPASFTGGAVKPTGSNSEEYQDFVITSDNNELVLKPNGAENPIMITIPEDTYTVTEMKTKLNELFETNGLKNQLAVTEFESSGFKGLKITSLVEGVTSDVGIDSTCSAYETLFTKREYNSVSKVYPQSDSKADRDAYILGAKELSTGLTIDAANNQFKVLIKKANSAQEEVTITLTNGANRSLDDVITEINTQLSGKGVTATKASGRLKITGDTGSGVESVTAKDVDGNKGYENIFIKKTQKVTYQTLSGSSVTLPDIPTGGFDDTNNKITITVGNRTETVTLPTGNPTEAEIIQKIKEAIPEKKVITDNTFTRVSATGSSTNRNFNLTDTGETKVNGKSYSNTGSSDKIEGAPGVYENNTPAQITLSYAVPSSITIDDTCNNLQLNVNGKELSLTIENGTYNASELKDKVQEAIDKAFGKYYGGAKVSLNSDNKLVFEARLAYSDGYMGAGANTSISCSTGTSNFLAKLHTEETPASVTGTANILSNIVITADNNTFDFTLNGQNASVKLQNGVYATPAAFVTELNKAFDKAGYKVTASLVNGQLCLTTDEVGDNVSIGYSSSKGGSSSLAIFGDLTKKSPAEIILNQTVQQSITIDDSSNQFVITVNGTQETITLANDTYDRTSFLTMLNNKLSGKGVTASYSGNKLKLTTEKTGNDASIAMSYDAGGSSMKAIYGQTTTVIPGVEAEFVNGKLVLSGTGGASVKVTAAENNAFFEPDVEEVPTNPTTVTGYSSTTKSYIDGHDLTTPITIDEYNNNLSFVYHEDGNATTVTFELDKKDYTYAQLAADLQTKIDGVLGADKLKVTVTADGVRIEAEKPGNKYTMSSFSGDFYNKIISTTSNKTSTLTPTKVFGRQTKDEVYAVGRKDVKNKTTLIRDKVNDTLVLDLTYGNSEITFTMKLDAGEYSAKTLVAEIQEKLNEQLVANGFAENLIVVSVGEIDTEVEGANDENALGFKLSETVKLPAEGQYIIDGVRGNAAFTVFYQTEGELEPAYIGGTKDISDGVAIKDGENELSFKVDGTEYTITIPTTPDAEYTEYTAEEIINKLNKILKEQNIPAVAENYKNTIRLTYPSLGKHTISDVRGSAKEEIFFQENGETGDRKGIMIQMSGNASDSMEIARPIVNTSFLGINSVAITRAKYANKALRRLDEAINRVSEIRSDFGSTQNRLEHAVNNNQNTSENTQAAESRIRDTDMASEVMANTKYAILQQTTEAIMAHAKVQAENIIKLLQG